MTTNGKDSADGGYLIPGVFTDLVPVFNNWFGRILMRWLGIGRREEVDLWGLITQAVRDAEVRND